MQHYGFPRTLRLLTAGDFNYVFKNAQFKGNHKAILLLARLNKLKNPRLGFVISKRNVKLASNRNRIKRIIRDQFRLLQYELPSIDIVTIARRPVADMENVKIHQTISRLFSELIHQYDKTAVNDRF
jgi:ribonuclease P protein component